MSGAIDLAIRTALQNRLATITPAITTLFENEGVTPVDGSPYQRVTLMPIQPDDPTMGNGLVFERGIFHILLCYPLNVGVGPVTARAKLIKDSFRRALSLVSGGVTVTIERTPEVAQGQTDVKTFNIPVRITYFSQNLNP